MIWLVAALLIWVTGWFANTEGFVIAAEHFVERHGLVIIIALGESIVVIGVAAAGIPLDLRLVVVALLGARPERSAVVALLPRRGGHRARDGARPIRRAGLGSRSSASGTGTTGCCSAWSRSRPA